MKAGQFTAAFACGALCQALRAWRPGGGDRVRQAGQGLGSPACRASDSGLNGAEFRVLRGFDFLRALAVGPRLAPWLADRGLPPTPRRSRLRAEPLPILPQATLFDGIDSVSRPIEGLDSHDAVRTLRSSAWRANGASRLRRLLQLISPSSKDSSARTRSVRAAGQRSSHSQRSGGVEAVEPLDGARHAHVPKRNQSSSGRVGRGWAPSEPGRSGHLDLCGRLLSAALQRRAEESCREPAESRPFRPGFRRT